MYYVQRGSVPPQRHTQHRAPDGSLYAEELFGVEGFTGRSSLLYHLTPPTRTHRIEPVADGPPRGRRRRPTPPSPDQDRRGRAARRRRHRPHPALLQQRRRVRRRPARRPMPDGIFYRNGVADEMLFVHEGTGVCDTIFGPLRYGPATTSSCRSARPGGSTRTRARRSGSCTSRRRRRSSRRSATATTTASCSSTRRTRSATSTRRTRSRPADDEGEFVIHVRSTDRHHRLPLPPPPVRRRRLGRLPVAVPLQHRRLPADHRARPPAAAGPPDVPGAELRRVLVRAPQVRLPPAGDPGAVQPLEHQLATRSSTTSRATS